MKKWQGVQVCSKGKADSKINCKIYGNSQYVYGKFSIYIENIYRNLCICVSAANEKVATGVVATLDGLQNAADSVNKHVEEWVLVKARCLSQQLNTSRFLLVCLGFRASSLRT